MIIRTHDTIGRNGLLSYLLALGYTFHDNLTTVEEINNRYSQKEVPFIEIKIGKELSGYYSSYSGPTEATWPEQASKVLEFVFNDKSKRSVSIEGFMDHIAKIDHDGIHIGCRHIPFEQFDDIVERINNKPKKVIADRLDVYTETEQDWKTLMGSLFALGYDYHGRKTVDEAHQQFPHRNYNMIGVTPSRKAICGNGSKHIDAKHQWPKDAKKIFEYITLVDGSDKSAPIEIDLKDHYILRFDGKTFSSKFSRNTFTIEKFKELESAVAKYRAD